MAVRSMDAMKYADDMNDCRSQCNDQKQFNCNSFSYQDNQCQMSGEWFPGPVELKVQQGSQFMARTCNFEPCRGLVTYERVTGFSLDAIRTNLTNESVPFEECRSACHNLKDCLAFVYEHNPGHCFKLDRNSQGRSTTFFANGSSSYFEKVCLQLDDDADCSSKLWTFSRTLGARLPPEMYVKSVEHVQSRRDCEVLCLNERSFHCLSAVYDENTIECKLSNQRRNYDVNLTVDDNLKVSYLENQCAKPINLDCDYEQMDGLKNIVFEQKLTNTSVEQCRERCEQITSFECNAFSFDDNRAICLLSHTMSLRNNEHLESDLNYSYFQRNCTNDQLQPTPRDGGGCISFRVMISFDYSQETHPLRRPASLMMCPRLP